MIEEVGSIKIYLTILVPDERIDRRLDTYTIKLTISISVVIIVLDNPVLEDLGTLDSNVFRTFYIVVLIVRV